VTGGVLSGLGKGIVTASILRLLSDDYNVIPIKCDGYLNIDPGTMAPTEHGEVFVLDDGTEVDMDFGHYERFSGKRCKGNWNLTSGKIFLSLIEQERMGKFLGKTLQVIPHATDEIKRQWLEILKKEKADIGLVEVGGTVGDIENQWFLEAARQLKKDFDVCYIHLGLIPVLDSVGEQKTKPIQQSVKVLNNLGIFPNIVFGRSTELLTKKIKEKIALFCNINKRDVFSDPSAKNVYEIPLIFEKQGFTKRLKKHLGINISPKMKKWENLVKKSKKSRHNITIAICGKYTALRDSYSSIMEAINHCAAHLGVNPNLKWIETTFINSDKEAEKQLRDVDGVVVPGGFGIRGIEGKIRIIKVCREKNLPFLGLCLGLQLAVVEFARNVCKLKNANSGEFDGKTKFPVIDILPEQKKVRKKGATMRLGIYKALLNKGSRVYKIYNNKEEVFERHRHRYEVNPKYHEILEKNGMVLSGKNKSKRLVEFIEIPGKRYFVATQAHPEFLSTFEKPAPLFLEFVKSCVKQRRLFE